MLMGKIYGACGHEVQWDAEPYSIIDFDRDGELGVRYGLVCKDCLEFYEKNGMVAPSSYDKWEKVMTTNAEASRLAEEHWAWLESLLHKVYVDAMIHGYGHGFEDAEAKIEKERD
jgi:hypothetical protein